MLTSDDEIDPRPDWLTGTGSELARVDAAGVLDDADREAVLRVCSQMEVDVLPVPAIRVLPDKKVELTWFDHGWFLSLLVGATRSRGKLTSPRGRRMALLSAGDIRAALGAMYPGLASGHSAGNVERVATAGRKAP